MRKLLTLLLATAGSLASYAQSVTLSLTTAPCNNDGVVTANFSGLTPPLTVTWYVFGQPPIVNSGVMTTSDVLTNWAGGSVSVAVTDAGSNQAYDGLQSYPMNYTVATTSAVCPTPGTATASVTGGTAPYTYVWWDKTTLTTVSTTNPASLPEGDYGITITDANGCVFGSLYEFDSIQVYDNFAMQVAITTVPANCSNGSATITGVTGGTGPYTYLWSNAATTSAITGLMMGYYNVEVTDANGCDYTAYANVTQAVTIGANVTISPATCLQNDGSATSFGSGGMPPYTYLWSNTATTQTIGSLSAGNYSVTVTDANGCIGNGYANVFSSTPINVTYTTTPSSCTSPTGSATLTISGGTAPYTTVWNTFPVQMGITVSGVPAGNYAFTVTDAVGCVRTGVATIPPVNVISASFSQISPSCTTANGSLTVYPSGGTSPYTYSWSNSATTQTASSLQGGTHSVVITDAVGCTRTKSHYLLATTPITIGASTTPESCIFANDGAITVNPTGGTAPYTYSWNNGGTTSTITGLNDGQYIVSVTDVNGCSQTKYVTVPYNPNNNSCYCTVTGTVYNDANNNCTQDLGESGIPNIQMHLSGIGYAYTNANGDYSFIVPSGTYTLSETVQSYYPLATCQNNSISVNATASSGCTITNDFANTVATIHSVRVSSTHLIPPVPGNTYHLSAVITNQGTVTEAALMAGFKTDAQMPSPVFVPSTYYTGGTGGWYDIASGSVTLAPAASVSISKDYAVPTNIPLGTSLVFKDSTSYTASMSDWLNDYSPWNNVSYYQPVVVSSYDPNFKEVSPKGYGTQGTIFPQDSVLEYTVHFQNLGTWQAQNIVVLDTLDSDLDLTTLKPIYSTHPSQVTLTETGVLKYEFNNINLPAAMYNEVGSHGYFIYSIEVKPNLAQGTQFHNDASIYFDYNAPIVTNTTVNTLGWPQSVNTTASNASGTMALYPNPANNMFYAMISSEEDATADLTLVDVSGKVVVNKSLSVQKGSQTIPVDVSSLSPGIYFVKYANGVKSETQKLVIIQ